jgi:hypothetical protein
MMAAACRDSIAPTRSASGSSLVVSNNSDLAAAKMNKPSAGTAVFVQEFFIPAAGGTVRVGDYTLDFPANSVCNPATSGYGKKFWDKPCQTLNVDFAITATYWWENGQSYVEFSPDIRFDPSKTVVMSTNRPALIGKTALGDYSLWYWTRTLHGKQRLDEAAFNSTLRTNFDPATGDLFRRVQHFSGYLVNSGRSCDDTAGDPDCVSNDSY